jgi:hypothetical protein
MSLENVIKIGKLALSDEKLRNELLADVKGKTAANAAVAAAAFAKRHGFDATPAEVEKGYNIALKLKKGGEGELSDDELALVSGGGGSKGDQAAEGGAEAGLETGAEVGMQVLGAAFEKA